MESASFENRVFTSAASSGLCVDLRSDPHPTLISAWNMSVSRLNQGGTHFGFVQSGNATISATCGSFELRAGMYFCVPGLAEINGRGAGFVASRIGYNGFFHVGGPIEETGRLRYIDGCTDSLLIAPVVKGDPCLNLLHIPPQTRQTAHTHPSLRAGIIVSGEGVCQTANTALPLAPGIVFVIPTDVLHSFHTQSISLRVIAWHPDSDVGPTHENHPMVNRTWIKGQPVHTTGETV